VLVHLDSRTVVILNNKEFNINNVVETDIQESNIINDFLEGIVVATSDGIADATGFSIADVKIGEIVYFSESETTDINTIMTNENKPKGLVMGLEKSIAKIMILVIIV